MIQMTLNLGQLLIGLILAMLLVFISYRIRVLSKSGAAGTAIVGTVVFGLGGWLYAVPLLFFFISSSALSGLKSEIKLRSLKTIQKAGPRDIKQVFANGGVAVGCVLIMAITGNRLWFFLFLTGLCASTADTWATEIGTLLSSKPVSIISFKRVRPGQSGGVSVIGTLASLLGAILTMAAAYLTANIGGLNTGSSIMWLMCALAGFGGSIIDSILGATVQAGYRCRICGNLIEYRVHCQKQADLIKGVKIIDNDMVNLLSNIGSLGIFLLVSFYFKLF
jgi:uncharacterized protein (TIGR00297 family)